MKPNFKLQFNRISQKNIYWYRRNIEHKHFAVVIKSPLWEGIFVDNGRVCQNRHDGVLK